MPPAEGGATAGPTAPELVARVLPDVAGIDKEFDYLVPAGLAPGLRPGAVVRVPLHGRHVRGWVTAFPVPVPEAVPLLPLQRVLGWGPEPEVLAVAPWAAWRWAGRRRNFLVTASSLTLAPALPPPVGAAVSRPGPAAADRQGPATTTGPEPAGANRPASAAANSRGWAPGTHLLRRPPTAGATDLVLEALEQGRALVLAPTVQRAQAGAFALRRRGARVALLPEDWAQARSGADVVIGTRRAAWGPCPGFRTVVVLDAHEEAYVQEQAPTWDAATVCAERARRAEAACTWVSPCPTLELEDAADDLSVPPASAERHGWAPLLVADQRDQDPRLGLFSKMLVDLAREGKGRLVCVLNRKGRALLLACGACGELATCEQCGAAVAMAGDGLHCRRCGAVRPVVCRACASDGLRTLRLGVSRAREQLEALTGLPTAEVTAGSGVVPATPIVVGTEAVLYREAELRRGGEVGTVAFLDFDQELHAPRYRAAEQALALLARASRLVGGRQRGGRALVQTRAPGHPVIEAAQRADPGRLSAAERPVRKALRLPPFSALAIISGPGAAELAGSLRGLEVVRLEEERFVARADGPGQLADALAAAGRPAGPARVEVGPVRF